jgi:5-methylcytosine-specific restriction protein A
MKMKWQAPGNSRSFDCPFEYIKNSPESMSHRSMLVLRFFSEHNGCSFKNIAALNTSLVEYLKQKNQFYQENKSLVTHHYKPLVYFGLINYFKFEKGIKIFISYEGRNLLNAFDNNNYAKVKKIFLNSILNVKYPNRGVDEKESIGLFPFRILFYLLNKQKVTRQDLITWVVYINHVNELFDNSDLKKFLSENEIKKYDKFYIWVIASLNKLGFLDIYEQNGNYVVCLTGITSKETSKYLVSNNVENMFFDNNNPYDWINKSAHFFGAETEKNSHQNNAEQCALLNSQRCSSDIKNNASVTNIMTIFEYMFQEVESNVRVELCQSCYDKLIGTNIEEKLYIANNIIKVNDFENVDLTSTDIMMFYAN